VAADGARLHLSRAGVAVAEVATRTPRWAVAGVGVGGDDERASEFFFFFFL